MMLINNFYSLQKRLSHRRLSSKIHGYRIRHQFYVKFDPPNNRYVLSSVYAGQQYNPAKKQFEKKPHETWETTPVAYIYPDHILIDVEFTASNMRYIFGITHVKAKSNKFAGRTWRNFRLGGIPETPGDAPMRLDTTNSTLTAVNAPAVRVIDKSAQKEMNLWIKRTRRLLAVRAKLGVFGHLSRGDIDVAFEKTGLSQWNPMGNPTKFLRVLKAITEDDVTSFYPILKLINTGWDSKALRENDYVGMFNNLINRSRETLRKELGAVAYVSPPQ